MSSTALHHASEQESRQVAEASRQDKWEKPSFLRDLFLGRLRLDLVHPYPLARDERPEFAAFFVALRDFLREQVDPVAIDRSGEYPPHVVDGLRKLGAFGMKIPKQYGGLGFTGVEYQKVMKLLGSFDGNLSALLSAHQSIGVPQPLKVFGTETLKQKYLPRCAAGEISAFALTELEVGSDPARLATTAELNPAGDTYILNGTKLWCTNGTFADLLVVMARDPRTKKISAFVVESKWEGVKVEYRCRFMGLRAISNAVISFTNVKVPRENLIGEEGKGLKIALTTLNDGRLSIPNGSVGAAKLCLEICRKWAAERVQWGRPVGRHEAISHKLAEMASTTYAMEALADLATAMSDRGDYDIRLEAAAAKLWNTERTWQIVDDTMQIRGGRGYETADSLAGRGEPPIPVEQIMRDYRINRTFEGSSEIMHLFMAREAVDKHLEVAGALIDPKKGFGEKLGAFGKAAGFYAWWYPSRWLGWGRWPRYGGFGSLASHLRFVERKGRKLARSVFHGMVVHQGRLQNKQAFLFRLVDVSVELMAMAAAVSRAQALAKANDPDARSAHELADVFCRDSRRRVNDLFAALWKNDDTLKYKAGVGVLDGKHVGVERGGMGLHLPTAPAPKPTVAEPVTAGRR